jgi:thiamine biosynthesis protein ThiC
MSCTLGELTQTWKHDVQVMIEGPAMCRCKWSGKRRKAARSLLLKRRSTLGPLITDISPATTTSRRGRVTSAGMACAMLYYVTPKEHLCQPTT